MTRWRGLFAHLSSGFSDYWLGWISSKLQTCLCVRTTRGSIKCTFLSGPLSFAESNPPKPRIHVFQSSQWVCCLDLFWNHRICQSTMASWPGLQPTVGDRGQHSWSLSSPEPVVPVSSPWTQFPLYMQLKQQSLLPAPLGRVVRVLGWCHGHTLGMGPVPLFSWVTLAELLCESQCAHCWG
jgi:hypothetical protein